MPSQVFRATVGSNEIIVETGKLAGQANGAVTVRAGDTLLLCTATMSHNPREGIDFFPLSVDYEERLYAAGKIPGSYFRREGRPTEGAILVCRLTDRPLRPLFPKDLRNDVQVIITSLSTDHEHQIDILGIVSASAALTISDIPFGGPVGAVRVGYINDQFVVNPLASQMADSKLDMPQGTLDLLILKALSLEPMHGWAISQRIQQVSRDRLQIPQGSLYPALHRLERKGWIKASWGESDNNRKAKYYQLTRAGQARLTAETDDWARLTAAVALVMRMS